MPAHESVEEQAQKILDAIAFKPFEQCQPLNRKFDNIPARPGLYAIRHESIGLLYIGKTKSLRGRFRGGHKAFLWAWLKLPLRGETKKPGKNRALNQLRNL